MYCNKCGAANKDTSLFCEKCGNKLIRNIANNQVSNLNQGFNNGQENNNINQYNPVNQNNNVNMNQNNSVNMYPNNNINMNQNMYYNQMNNANNNQKKNNKTLFIIGGIIIGVIILIVCLVLLIPKNSKPGNKQTVSMSRTIMIYMIGSDLESEGGMASLDIEEIEKSGVNLSHTNIVVYAGGANDWENDFENNTIYELTDSGFEFVKQDTSTSMGSEDTLTGFLDYVKENYESDSYGLILWDHGAGPIAGYGIDEVHNDDGLFIYELENALKYSKFGSEKLEFIGFDACLMASAEVASVLSDYAKYMIASQDLEPGYGWDYTFLSEVDKTTNTEGLGKLVIDYMDEYYKDLSNNLGGTYEFYTTLSLLDLSKIDSLEENLNDLFIDVDVALSNNGYSKIVSQITKAKSFGYAGYNQSYDLIDLGGVADELSLEYKEKAQALKDSIDEVVVYQKTNVEGANGISIYYPYYTKTLINEFLNIYETLDFAEDYTKFLNNYSKILTGQRIVEFDTKTIMPELSEDNEEISVTLDTTVASNYNKASYVIFRDMKDGYYMPVYKSSDVTLKNNILIANFDKKQLSVTDADGEAGWATMFEYERNDSYVIYNVPIIMYKYGEDFSDSIVDNAYVQLRVDKSHPNGTIVGVVPISDVNDTSTMKQFIDLDDWDYIQFFNSEYDFYDDVGNYTSEWQSSGTYYLTEVVPEEGYTIEFTELDSDYNYYCMFQIDDTQGNISYTNLIKIN